MKVKQEGTEYKPIHIVLETKQEAIDLWDFIEAHYLDIEYNTRQKELLIDISNELTDIDI